MFYRDPVLLLLILLIGCNRGEYVNMCVCVYLQQRGVFVFPMFLLYRQLIDFKITSHNYISTNAQTHTHTHPSEVNR